MEHTQRPWGPKLITLEQWKDFDVKLDGETIGFVYSHIDNEYGATVKLKDNDKTDVPGFFKSPTEFLHAARSTDPNMGALCDSSGLRPVSFLKF